MDKAESVPRASRKLIKIGVGAPLSGNGADLGREMAQAIQLAIEEVNQVTGGVCYEAVICDDRGDEDHGLEIARSFGKDPSLVAVIGHYNSNVTLRVAPCYLEADLALVAPIVSNPMLTESGWDNVFRFTNRDDATAAAIANYLAARLHKRNAVIVETDTVYGRSMSTEFIHAFEREGGAALTRRLVQEGEKDFAGLVASLPNDFDVVFYGGTFEGAPLLKALRSSGRLQLMATGDGCWDIGNFLEPVGALAELGEGVLVLSACPEVGKVDGSADFAARYERQFGPVRNYAANSYDATMTLLHALRTVSDGGAGYLSRTDVLKALRRVKHQGIAYPGPVQWDVYGDNISSLTALHIVKDRKFQQVALIPRHVRT